MAMAPRSGALLGGDDVLEAYRLNSALRKSARPTSREEWAKALLQQGSAGTPVGSPIEGLAKMLTAGVGGYIGGEERRAGEQSEAQMLADMMGRKSQQQAEEQRQLAGLGVPGFSQPPAPVEPGIARAVPTATGGVEAVPQGFDAPPTRAPANVDAALIQAVAAMQAGGNKTAGSALPGLQFAYGDIRDREREAKADAREAARDARAAASASREPEQVRLLRALGIDPTSPQARELLFPKSVAGGPAAPFAGQSPEASALNIVLAPDADPSSPVYAAAFNKLYGPKTTQQLDGTIITLRPEVPDGVRRPVGAGQSTTSPSGAATGGGTASAATTTTPGGASVERIQGASGNLTEAQSKANMFGNAMTEGHRIISETGAPSTAAILAWRNLPEAGVNLGLPEKDQKYFNALRQFAAGVLRKETGAAFTPNELLDVQSRFFPMPGDTVGVKEQKTRARLQAIESMRAEIPGSAFRGQLPPPSPTPGLAGAQPPDAASNIPVISSPAEAARLPPGTVFRTPDGQTRRVPVR